MSHRRKMRVLIASGGTGGHVFPALSVAAELKNRCPDVHLLLMGSLNRSLDGSAFADALRVVPLPAVGMPHRVSVALAPFAFRMLMSFDQAVRRISSFQPHVAIGFGNFVSVAPLLAAKSRGVPIVIHEANAIPGKANLLLSRLSDKVLVNFPKTVGYFPKRNGSVKVVGMPVRSEFRQERNRLGALAQLNLSGTEFTLLVAGGSQGAQALNQEVCGLLPRLEHMPQKVQIIHLTGRADYSWVKGCYEKSPLRSYVSPFESRMKVLYDAADLILCRAGASTIAEIIEVGKPAILVPFPHATDRHQDENARCLKENGGALVVPQRVSPSGQVCIPGLFEKVAQLIRDGWLLPTMAARNHSLANGAASSKIADVLFEVGRPRAVPVRRTPRRIPVPA